MNSAHNRPDPSSPLDGLSILVADDRDVIRRYVTEALTRAGAAVNAVADGQAALDSIRAAIPDLVVLDLAMPVKDGWTVLADLADDPELAKIPTLVITAHRQSSLASGIDHLGANQFLAKPFTPRELLGAIERLMADVTRPTTAAWPPPWKEEPGS